MDRCRNGPTRFLKDYNQVLLADGYAGYNGVVVGNPRGGRTAAILSSLTSTCRRHDIDPQLYCTQLLINLPTLPISRLPEWLPDQWKIRHTASLENLNNPIPQSV